MTIHRKRTEVTFDQRESWKEDAQAQPELDNLNSSNV